MYALKSGRLLMPAALALGVSLLIATPAIALPKAQPQPSDARATMHSGNATTCAQAGLSGTTVTFASVREQDDNTSITITAADIPAGDTLVGVVVKGGPGYNVYQGLTEWTNLISPKNPGGQIPTISHWFACVTQTKGGGGGPTPPPTQPTQPGGPTGTQPGGGGAAGGPGNTPSPSVAGASVANTAGAGELPNTGFGNSWLIWVGGLLVLAGGGALAFQRVARRR